MANRYVNASERSVAILEGALLYGVYMNTPGNVHSVPLASYLTWLKKWDDCEEMDAAAKRLQAEAFESALRKFD